MEPADVVLLERWVGRRDADAFQAIVRRHSAMVFSACRRVLGDPASAEDVTQECFLKLAMGDARPGPFLGPWLHRMATRHCLDTLRSEQRRRAREVKYVAEGPQSTEARWETLEPLIDEALTELPERFRVPIAAHFLEGLSHEEVAQRLGMPRQTVSYRISRGLERMGTWLRSRGVNVASGALVARLGDMPVEGPPPELAAKLSKMALARTAQTLPHLPWFKTAIASYGTGALVAALMGVAGFVGVGYVIASRDSAPEQAIVGELTRTVPEPSQQSRRDSASSRQSSAGLPASAEQPAANAPLKGSPTPSTASESEPGAIAGSVVDEDGQPVPDARVRVLQGKNMASLKIDAERFSTTTDAQGLFHLAGIPSQEPLVLNVNAEGFTCPNFPSFTLEPGKTLEDRRIVLAKGITLFGRVIGRDGKPVADALVIPDHVGGATRIGGGGNVSAQTDAKGLFELGFREECTAVLQVLTRTWGEAIFKIEVQADAFEELRMPAPARLTGRVTHADGKSAPDVNVVLCPIADEEFGIAGRYENLTDAEGHYEFPSLPPDVKYVATVKDSSSKPLTNLQDLGILAAGAARNFDIRLGQPARLHGSVLGERTGRPQRGAHVGWVREGDSDDSAATTGADGSYELELFESGSYCIYAIPAPGDLNKDCRQKYGRTVNVVLDAEQTLDFRLPDAFSMGVRVVDGQGNPIPNASVSAAFIVGPQSEYSWGGGWKTDATGRYRYEGFQPGYESWLTVESLQPGPIMSATYSGNGARRVDSAHVEGAPGVDYPEETVVLYGSSGLSGVALSPDGQPFAQRPLSVMLNSPGVLIDGTRVGNLSVSLSVKTDASGAFALTENVPAASLSPTLMLQAEDGRVYKAELEPVECRPGQVMDLGRPVFQFEPDAKMEVVTGSGMFFTGSSGEK